MPGSGTGISTAGSAWPVTSTTGTDSGRVSIVLHHNPPPPDRQPPGTPVTCPCRYLFSGNPRDPVLVPGLSFVDPTKGQYAGREWRRILEYYRAWVNTIPSGNKPAAHYEWQ
jgi:hypothetical protein